MICNVCGGAVRKGVCNICEILGNGAPPAGPSTTGWPMKSDALAVHSKQVDKANARAKRHGVNVHYRKDGRCVIPDRVNYAKLLKLEGLHNKSEGYHGA